MVLHDAYHIYTVDEHSLKLIQEIERLQRRRLRIDALPLLTQIAREAEKIELLYLGHDVSRYRQGFRRRPFGASAPRWFAPSPGAWGSMPTMARWWSFSCAIIC